MYDVEDFCQHLLSVSICCCFGDLLGHDGAGREHLLRGQELCHRDVYSHGQNAPKQELRQSDKSDADDFAHHQLERLDAADDYLDDAVGLLFNHAAHHLTSKDENHEIDHHGERYAQQKLELTETFLLNVLVFAHPYRLHVNGGVESFVTSDGHKTSVYYNAQTLLNEMQALAPVIMNFEYRASKTIAHEPVAYPIAYSEIKDMKFAKLKNSNVKLQEGRVCFMTELYDKTHKNYMYMMENIMDPRLFDPSEDDLNMKFSINFGSDYNAVEVYYRGVKRLVPLKDGVYSSSLDAGYAEFLIPYKA